MSTLKRILAATDFSPAAHAALGRAAQIAALHGADIHVIHATPDWTLFSNYTAVHQEHYELLRRDAERALDAEMRWLADHFAIRAHGEVHQGRASETILRAIQAYQPHLLVIGAHGERVAPAAETLGGTALQLVSPVFIPTLLVRNPGSAPYQTSVAAIRDASELSRRIVEWASVLVGSGVCHVVRAFEVPYLQRLRLSGVPEAVIDISRHDQEEVARKETQALVCACTASAQVRAHVVPGAALTEIFTQLEALGAQLLVVGQQHRPSDTVRALTASSGSRLAYHAHCDVLVVP